MLQASLRTTLFLPPFCLAPAATVADTVAGGSSPLQDPLCPWPCQTGFIPGTTAHFGSLNAHRRIARYFYSWRWAWYTGPVFSHLPSLRWSFPHARSRSQPLRPSMLANALVDRDWQL